MNGENNQTGNATNTPPDYQTPPPPYQPDSGYNQTPPPPYQQPPPYQPYQQYPPYNPQYIPVYIKPKIPGRGYGIASMVLGIIGIFYSFVTIIMAFTVEAAIRSTAGFGFNPAVSELATFSVIVTAVVYSVFAILSCVFSLVAMKRGYKNGVSSSGLVMSLVTFALLITAIIVSVMRIM